MASLTTEPDFLNNWYRQMFSRDYQYFSLILVQFKTLDQHPISQVHNAKCQTQLNPYHQVQQAERTITLRIISIKMIITVMLCVLCYVMLFYVINQPRHQANLMLCDVVTVANNAKKKSRQWLFLNLPSPPLLSLVRYAEVKFFRGRVWQHITK